MNITVEIAGRKALPVWTIPYATGRCPSPDRLLTMLAKPVCDEGRYSKFPSAFNLDNQGKPTLIPPGQWTELARQIEKLDADLTDKNLPSLEDRQEWCKRPIELMMPYRAYIWLDELEDWFGVYRQRFVFQDEVPELCLNPLMPLEHNKYFETTENPASNTGNLLTDEVQMDKRCELELTKDRQKAFVQIAASRAKKSDWTIEELIDKPLTELINRAKTFKNGLLNTNNFDFSFELYTWKGELENRLINSKIEAGKVSQAKDKIEEINQRLNDHPPFKNAVPEFIVGEPELVLEDSISFYQAKDLFDRQATDEEFALYVFDSQIRAYEDRADNGKLRAIFNIQDWLLTHGKVECFSGEPCPVDSALDRFRFSKREIEAFKPEFRYVQFAKAKEIIVNHLGEPDKADRFLIRNLQFNSIGAYHPFFGRVLPENALDGERWRKCFIPDWQLHQLAKDLPTALDDNQIAHNLGKDCIQKGTISQFGELPGGLKLCVGAETKEAEKPNIQSLKDDECLPEQQAKNVKPLVKRTRKDNLNRAIDAAISFFNQKPSFDELWQYFLDDKDETGIIEDYTDTHITWKCTKGRFHDTKKETLANRLSRIKI